MEDSEEGSDGKNDPSECEMESLGLSVAAITTEREAPYHVNCKESELEKVRVELWRINCKQLSEYDSLLVAKDEPIVRLTAQLRGVGTGQFGQAMA